MSPPNINSETTVRTRKRRTVIQSLLLGPLMGGTLIHLWDFTVLNRYSNNQHANDVIYAAEFAPQIDDRRRQRTVVLGEVIDRSSRDNFSDLSVAEKLHSRDRQSDERRNNAFMSTRDNIVYNLTDVSDDQDDCVPMHSWQTSHHPMCNYLHEIDFLSNFRSGDLEYIDSGGFNDLFHYIHHNHNASIDSLTVTPVTTELAIKILSLETRTYSPHNYQIVRQDAVIQERLTSSPYIFPIYGYCGFALVLPYVAGGTLSSNLRKWRKGELQITSRQRLMYALDMAKGLRDLHNIDGDDIPSVTHGDLKEQQYLIMKNGDKERLQRLQLGDFNKGTFLSKSQSSGIPCAYNTNPGHADKVFRSPEEYAYKPQTAATDVWALGSLMFYLLTGSRVWREIAETHTKKVRKYIIEGRKPEIEDKILNSKDPVDIALKKAYDMACAYDPLERATAKEVSDYLEGVWNELGY